MVRETRERGTLLLCRLTELDILDELTKPKRETPTPLSLVPQNLEYLHRPRFPPLRQYLGHWIFCASSLQPPA